MLRSLLNNLSARKSVQASPASRRLHLGCGRNPLAGWVNLDAVPLDGVEVVADLDACRRKPLPFRHAPARKRVPLTSIRP